MLPANLESVLMSLRSRLDGAFGPDTAAAGFRSRGPLSAGHCAAVATIVQQILGGDLVSAAVRGQSHWFNRLPVDAAVVIDVDLTGDQFGLPPIRVALSDRLFPGTRVRTAAELRPETIERTLNLAERAALHDVAASLRDQLEATLDPVRR